MIIVLNFQAPQNTGVNTGVTAASSTSISAASTVRTYKFLAILFQRQTIR